MRALFFTLVLAAAAIAGACASSATAVPVVVVTPDHCAVVELELDGGITETICLTSSQIEKAFEP